MKHTFAFTLLVLVVFGAGIGIGSIIGLELPASNGAISNFETYTTSSRALSFNEVQAGTVKTAEPLKAVPQQPNLQGPVERPSPSDWIQESQIEMQPEGVFIKLNNPQWAILANTNSMDPGFDEDSHLIQEIPRSENDIQVGDIISYESPLGFSIVHRVVEKSSDEDGTYFIARGDNNPGPDPWKIRWPMVTRVTVAIIY